MYQGNAGAKHFGDDAQAVIKKKPTNELSATEGVEEVATFAGGCFWGLELSFQRVPGVLRTEVGYTQGHKEDPVGRAHASGWIDCV